jgi:hypothetical protein
VTPSAGASSRFGISGEGDHSLAYVSERPRIHSCKCFIASPQLVNVPRTLDRGTLRAPYDVCEKYASEGVGAHHHSGAGVRRSTLRSSSYISRQLSNHRSPVCNLSLSRHGPRTEFALEKAHRTLSSRIQLSIIIQPHLEPSLLGLACDGSSVFAPNYNN